LLPEEESRVEDHLSIETLARWLAGDLEHEELVGRVIPHFLAVCPVCRETYEEIARLKREAEHWDERVAVFEGRQAPELLEELLPHPFDVQVSMVRDDERFQTWGLCQVLLKRSLKTATESPLQALALAELAVRISELLVDEAYDPNWVFDLRAKAWSYLGNAFRVLGELWGAERAFHRAEEYLEQSTTGNLYARAELRDLESSLRRAQRRLDEAQRLSDEALDLYSRCGDDRGVAIVLIKRAKLLEERGELEASISTLLEADGTVERVSDARLLLCVRHNLVWSLTTAGRHAEAEALLSELRQLATELGNPLDLVRLRWAEGRIEMGLGRRGPAEAAFREVQREFFERRMGYDAALVSLDLAILYAEEGATAAIKQLAVEVLPAFESREVHREAFAALIMFQQAAEEERMTVALARNLAAFLGRERGPVPR
jgi:tetratricopeptide (TPR) repeat protein